MPTVTVTRRRHLEPVRAGEVAERTWQLMTRPACWPAWAPHFSHVTTADGDAPATIAPGQRLSVHTVVPGVSVPVEIDGVRAPEEWSMVAPTPVLGPVRSDHRLEVTDDGLTLQITISSTSRSPVVAVALQAYRPVAELAVHRLLSLADDEAAGASGNRLRMCDTDPE